jgi:hypothetical protein
MVLFSFTWQDLNKLPSRRDNRSRYKVIARLEYLKREMNYALHQLRLTSPETVPTLQCSSTTGRTLSKGSR